MLARATRASKPTDKGHPMTSKTANLTHERLQDVLHYAPETGVFTWKKSLRTDLVGYRAGSISRKGYRCIEIGGVSYRCCRLAWFYVTGDWPSEQIDHINQQKGDDRFCNLREATNAQNLYNRPPAKDNTSGVTGVYWLKPKKRWVAMGFRDNQRVFLGSFKEKDKAIEARRAFAAEAHGRFVYDGGR